MGVHSAKAGFNPILPGRIEAWTARHPRQKVDPDRRNPELDDPPWIRQIRNGQTEIGTPKEVAERSQCALGVRRSGVQQDIKVLCLLIFA